MYRPAIIAAFLLSLVAACQPEPENRSQSTATGAIATAHPLATEAARQVMLQGGNAADAAIAAGFALAVVEPSMSNLGGRVQILVRTPDGNYKGYNGMTQVPAGFVAPEEPPAQGYGTIATPGVVAAHARLHAEHGSLGWSTLLKEPVRLARDGFELLPGAAARHAAEFESFREDAGFQEAFVEPDGTAYDAGDLLRQPALASTIKRLAETGAADFYRGEIAKQIAADMAANGGYVTADDLATYEVLDGRYITTSYRGYDIHTLAAPAGGGLVVKALNILENIEMGTLAPEQWAAAVNQALALTLNSMAEDRGELDLERVADKTWAAEQAASIRIPQLALSSSMADSGGLSLMATTDWTGATWGSDSHHTTHFTIADCEGRIVSITQTIGPLFGARVITPGLGFVYAATMGSYLSAADQAPGSRPRTTIAPTVVTRDGKLVLALGAAGGIRILSAIVQTISRFVDQGHDPATAVALPRVQPVREESESGDYVAWGERMHLEMTPERGWAPDVAEALTAAGFEVLPVDKQGAFARVHLVANAGGSWVGVADPDWEGSAASIACSRN